METQVNKKTITKNIYNILEPCLYCYAAGYQASEQAVTQTS